MNTKVFNQFFLLFGLIIVGYITNKTGILDEPANNRLSSFLLKIALPATILNSALENQEIDRDKLLSVTIIAIGVFMVIPLLSKLIARIANLSKTYQLMLNYSNLGFMGFPIISSIYGEDAVIYAAVFLMVFNVHIFTVGISLLQGKSESPKLMLKKLCSPGVISALLAFAIVLFGFSIPVPLANLFKSLGSVTTPLAMIVIGSQLAQVNLLNSLANKKIYLMSCIKLVVYPAVVYGILRLVVGQDVIAGIAAILIGLPVAGNVTMICSEYGGDTALAAEGTCISTILSLITIPIMLALI